MPRYGASDMAVLYLDASAIVKLIVPEAESFALIHLVEGRRLVTSVIACVEVARAAARAFQGSHRGLDIAPVFETMTLIQLQRPVVELAAVLLPQALRLLDAIHLATALRLPDMRPDFVTYDHRLAEAARSQGLTVLAPQ